MEPLFTSIPAISHSTRLKDRKRFHGSYIRGDGLWVAGLGDSAQWAKTSIALVGTRRPTAYGIRFIRELVKELSVVAPHWNLISGGAFGVDAEVHRAALRQKVPSQAWLVGPRARPHPQTHRELFAALAQAPGSNLFVPAFLDHPPGGGSPPRFYWILRNQWLVSAADALIVVEAAQKSGTWSTVKMSQRVGIPIFILPGPIDSPQSEGTNLMISRGFGHPIGSVENLVKSLVVELEPSSYNKRRQAFCMESLDLNCGGEPTVPRTRPRGQEPRSEAKAIELLVNFLNRPEGLSLEELWGLAEETQCPFGELIRGLDQMLGRGELRRSGDRFERRGKL